MVVNEVLSETLVLAVASVLTLTVCMALQPAPKSAILSANGNKNFIFFIWLVGEMINSPPTCCSRYPSEDTCLSTKVLVFIHHSTVAERRPSSPPLPMRGGGAKRRWGLRWRDPAGIEPACLMLTLYADSSRWSNPRLQLVGKIRAD